MERDTFYPPHNNIAEVETGDQANSFTHSSLIATLLSFSYNPLFHRCCSKSSTSYFQCKLLHIQSEKSGSKPLLRVQHFSDAAEPESESIEQDCQGQETETHLARN